MSFMARYGRSYQTKEEYELRKQLFSATLKEIEELNHKFKGRFQLKINQFADLSKEEFKEKYLIERSKPLPIQINNQET